MRLWRIQRSRYLQDALRGIAPTRFPGRWNHGSRPVVYTANSLASAVLEFAVHLPLKKLGDQHDYVVLAIDVPDFVSRERLRSEELPRDWTESLPVTQALGEDWLLRAKTCLLEVPSAVVPTSTNYLINPAHPDMEFLFPRPAEPLSATVDARLYGFAPTLTRPATPEQIVVTTYGKKELFLCHAEQDSETIATPLSETFFALGVSCWTRGAEILVGDSVTEKINEGLRLAKYFVVLLSPEFLRSPQSIQELASAMAKKRKQEIKKIFPIIVNYPDQLIDVATVFPMLADTQAIVWTGDPFVAASAILRSMNASM